MPIVRPLVIGPVSTLSRAIRVRGQFAGATVVIQSLPRGAARRTIAKGIARSADDRIPLDGGETLRADDLLYAIQSLGPDSSPTPNAGDALGVPVQSAPTTTAALTRVTFSSLLYACGRAVWLRGGVPGALGRLQAGGADIGSGTFQDEEGARFNVAPMLTGPVTALQSIPGVGDGPGLSRTTQDLPGPPRGPLPAPDIEPLPVACNTSVLVTHALDGAEVEIRGDGFGKKGMFDASALWVPLGSPLTEGEVLHLSQSVHAECSRQPTSRDVRVGPAPAIKKPTVAGHLCAGSSMVRIGELIPGAGLEVAANGKVYRAQVPPQATGLDVIVDPLEAPPLGEVRVVTAKQSQCGVFGPESDPVPVDPAPSSIPQHVLLPPLLACSPIVRVANARPGAMLMAFSDVFGPISGFVMADTAGNATIPVAPQLVNEQVIEVRQWACGGVPFSNFLAVGFLEALAIPTVGTVIIGRTSVDVKGLTIGASVELVVTAKDGVVKEMNLFVAAAEPSTARLQNPIADGDRVKARQGLCPTLTPYSAEVGAIVQPITADWWQWNGANPRNETWKEDYSAAGMFTNRGPTPITDFVVTIFEDAANAGNTSHGLVAPAQAVSGSTALIKKDWQWFIPGIWVVKGPTHKEFQYRAVVAAKAVTGSPYPETTSAALRIIVNVSKLKRAAGALAMGQAASAAAMAASIILLAGAAAAYAAAAISGAVALDPPEPDPNFRERIPLPPLGHVPPAGPDRTIIHMFRLCERVMQIELTKSLIEGRRLGASSANDETWIQNHMQDLAAATVLQHGLIAEIGALAPQARQDVLALVPPGTDLRSERLRLQVSGLTTALADQMQLPQVLRPGFDELLRSDVAVADPDIARGIDESLMALTEFAASLG